MLPILEHAMSLASLRGKALTQNLANANTQDYVRQEVPFFTMMQQFIATDGKPSTDTATKAIQPAPDGSGANLEKELAAISENALLYQAATRLASGRLAQLRYAISEGRR